jgi:hypothetical protein
MPQSNDTKIDLHIQDGTVVLKVTQTNSPPRKDVVATRSNPPLLIESRLRFLVKRFFDFIFDRFLSICKSLLQSK